MTKQRKRSMIIYVLAFILTVGAIMGWTYVSNSKIKIKDRDVIKIGTDQKSFLVEVVKTPASITLGLSGREEIGQSKSGEKLEGMLFELGEKRIPYFWMKDMKFDLDLVWIDDQKVLQIEHNVPAPARGTNYQNLPTYSPSQRVNRVLEVYAGQAEALGLKPGAMLNF